MIKTALLLLVLVIFAIWTLTILFHHPVLLVGVLIAAAVWRAKTAKGGGHG